MISELVEKLENSNVFKEWKKQNKEYYLVHAFYMIDPQVKKEWQIGYYNKDKDKIVTFCVNDEITINPAEDVFKKSGIINKLDISKIKVDFEKAKKIAEKFQEEHYPEHETKKKIIILQNLEKHVWNFTFISGQMATLNIKVNAETGKVFSHNLTNLFSFDKNLKK